MKNYRIELGLAALLLAFVAAVYLWQNPGVYQGKASAQEIDRYLETIAALPMPAEEMAPTLARVRQWLESDDGKPIYMLNLMRYYPELKKFPGALAFQGTPLESNARYEDVVIPMLPKIGAYPMYAGTSKGGNLMEFSPELNNWDRVLVVRYPSRRAFLNLLALPGYKEVEPYKLMALKVVLTPTQAETIVPDLTQAASALALMIFLAFGWWRSARRP